MKRFVVSLSIGVLLIAPIFTFIAHIPRAHAALTDGLVAHWQLDETSGTIASDASGNGNAGTLVNSPTWTAGRIGGALQFDGVNDQVDLGNPAALNFGTNSFTYSLWVNVPTSAGSYDMPFSKGGSSATTQGYDMELGTGNWGASLSDGSTVRAVSFGTETLNAWTLLTVVVDRSANTISAYKNGALVSTTGITGWGSVSSSFNARLGVAFYGTSYPFKGLLDDVRIYNRALSATEVSGLYAATPSPSDTTPPVISSIAASGITSSGATISWTTGEASDSQVEYGLTTSYGSTSALNSSMVASHSIALSGISAGTLYHYRVKSKDAAGNLAVSLDNAFRTVSGPDAQSPSAITNLTATNTQTTSSTLSWTAPFDLPNNSAAASYDLRYATSSITFVNLTSAVQVTGEPTPATPGTSQTYTLAGLAPSVTYHAVIVSKDAAGNFSPLSNVLSFTTATAAASVSSSVSSTASQASTASSGGGGGGGSYTPPPVTPPAGAKAHGATNQVVLTWVNPKDADFVRVKIFRSTTPIVGTASSWQQRGTLVYEGDREEFTDTADLLPDTTYHYGIFSVNRSLANSTVQALSARLGEKTDQQVIQAIANEKNESRTPSLSTPTPLPTPSASRYTKPLFLGARDSEVRNLQKLLNALGFTIAAEGPGSPGNETDFFGLKTKEAVARFQAERLPGVSPADRGLVGPATRAKLNAAIQEQGSVTAPSLPTPTPTSTSTPSASRYTKPLFLGARDSEVRNLQKLLNALGFTIAAEGPGSPGNETDFFGLKTKEAVARFQAERLPGVSPADRGLVGPATRAKLNAATPSTSY